MKYDIRLGFEAESLEDMSRYFAKLSNDEAEKSQAASLTKREREYMLGKRDAFEYVSNVLERTKLTGENK